MKPPLVTAPQWLREVRLSWRNAAFSRGEMRVEARHPDGKWLPLAPTRLFLRRRRIIIGAGGPSVLTAIAARWHSASAPVPLRAKRRWRNTAFFTIRKLLLS